MNDDVPIVIVSLGQEREIIDTTRSQIESIVGYHGTLNCDNAMQLLNASFDWSKIMNKPTTAAHDIEVSTNLHKQSSMNVRIKVPEPDIRTLKNSKRLQNNLKLLRNK